MIPIYLSLTHFTLSFSPDNLQNINSVLENLKAGYENDL